MRLPFHLSGERSRLGRRSEWYFEGMAVRDPDFERLSRQVGDWIAIDPDPETRAEALALLERAEAGDDSAAGLLRDAFEGRLAFGTAGLRAEQGAGPRRMNRIVIAQSSAGLAEHLLRRTGGSAGEDTRERVRGAAEDLSLIHI